MGAFCFEEESIRLSLILHYIFLTLNHVTSKSHINKKPDALFWGAPGFIVKVNLTNLLSFDSL